MFDAAAPFELDQLVLGDCLEVMRRLPDGCFDHCIADPPFNISRKRGLGWAFSSHITMQELWDRMAGDEFWAFNLAWLREVTRVVRPNGNIVVFGTYHNIYQLGFLLQSALDRRILNSIVYRRTNPQPNITARMLTEATEHLIWAVNETPERARHWTFNYWDAKEMNGGRQMPNVWEFPVTPRSERRHGKHPTQKPIALLERLVLLCSREGDRILDPFAGAGTAPLADRRHGRRWLGIENNPDYVEIAQRRLDADRAAADSAAG
jgi:site-specific DNA-methyltransferase (adenine-specific)